MKHLRRFFLAIIYREYLYDYFLFLRNRKKSNLKNLIKLKKFISLLERRFKKKHSKFTKCYNFKLTNQLSSLSLKQKRLFYLEKRQNYISSPNVLKSSVSSDYQERENQSPDVEISLLEDCYIYGQSICISDKKRAYNPVMYNGNFQCEQKNLAFQSFKSFVKKKVNLYINKTTPIDKTICVHLLDAYVNYYHWLFEILPKLIQINKVIQQSSELKKKHFTLIVNKKLPTQIIKSIKLVVQFNYEIKTLANFESLLCTKLIYCTPFWYSLCEKAIKGRFINPHFMDKKSTEFIRNQFYVKKESFKKVYFTRQSQASRSIINKEEIEEFLIQNNFEFYEPSKLSFEEQIKLLSETKILVSPSGAAISNMIFMQPNTAVLSFIANSPYTNPYVFQQIANVAQVNFYQMPAENESKDVNVNFKINLSLLKETLDKLKV